MSNEGVNLDTATWDDIGDAPPVVTDGQYTVQLKGVELKEKADKTGYFITYRAVVQNGPDAGHTIFSMWSLGPDQIWRFKAATKLFGLEQPSGLSVLDTIKELVPQIEGLVVVVKVGSKIRNVKDDSGAYVEDPEKQRENTINRVVGVAI